MEVQINLDAMTERYVRSMETRMEIYRARLWSVGTLCLLIGIVIGMAIVVVSIR